MIQAISQTVRKYGGNWTESNFAALEGVFVGIVKIEISEDKSQQLQNALEALSAQQIEIRYHQSVAGDLDQPISTNSVKLRLDANDREGIIEEITMALAKTNINIVDLESGCESASMVGYDLFSAEMLVNLPAELSQQDLIYSLEHISDDVMVSISD